MEFRENESKHHELILSILGAIYLHNGPCARRFLEVWLDAAYHALDAYALLIFLCDGILRLVPHCYYDTPSGVVLDHRRLAALRFFRIARRLPLELQIIVCQHYSLFMGHPMTSWQIECAFSRLAQSLRPDGLADYLLRTPSPDHRLLEAALFPPPLIATPPDDSFTPLANNFEFNHRTLKIASNIRNFLGHTMSTHCRRSLKRTEKSITRKLIDCGLVQRNEVSCAMESRGEWVQIVTASKSIGLFFATGEEYPDEPTTVKAERFIRGRPSSDTRICDCENGSFVRCLLTEWTLSALFRGVVIVYAVPLG
jgi:hypothetical protein